MSKMSFKKTSEMVTISASVTESAANTFTEQQIDLQLDPLNNEVFVVQAINLDVSPPDCVAGTNTQSNGSISTTSRTAIGSIADSQVMAVANDFIRMDAGSIDGAAFSRTAGETPTADMGYVAIIATDNAFLQVQGGNNTAAKTLTARVYGYRAKASAAVYAALVQSELLS